MEAAQEATTNAYGRSVSMASFLLHAVCSNIGDGHGPIRVIDCQALQLLTGKPAKGGWSKFSLDGVRKELRWPSSITLAPG